VGASVMLVQQRHESRRTSEALALTLASLIIL
jgi:hypothetical protein